MADDRYYNVAVVRDDPDGTRTLVGKIVRRKMKAIANLKKTRLPYGLKRKLWLVGDTESEDVYREQGWFPE